MASDKQRYWFRARTYGWGWTPVTWEGWAVTALFVLTVLIYISIIDSISPSISDTVIIATPSIILMGLLFSFICYRTGERPGWRWGKSKTK